MARSMSRWAMARAVLLVMLAGFCAAARAQEPAGCGPDSARTETVNLLKGQTHRFDISLDPCQVLEVDVAITGDDRFAAVDLNILNAADQSTGYGAWGVGNHLYGPQVGTRGAECLAKTGLLKCLNGKEGEPVGITYTVRKKRRPNYNIGAPSFDGAQEIVAPDTFFGSSCPTEAGQFWKIWVGNGETLLFDGYAEGSENRGTVFGIDVLDAPDNVVAGPVFKDAYGRRDYSGSWLNQGPTGYYVVRAYTQNWDTLDWRINIKQSRRGPKPPWADCPDDGSCGQGPSKLDPVDLSSGRESYEAEPDLAVYNPNGPDAVWQRGFYDTRALERYASPGLSTGWVHQYDITLEAQANGWGELTLVYASGARETLTPQLDEAGNPTGVIAAPSGSPFMARGTPDLANTTWQSIEIIWRDNTRWQFAAFSNYLSVLSRVSNRTGQTLALQWDAQRRLQSVGDEANQSTLIALEYDADGLLRAARDSYGRKVLYSFATPQDGPRYPLQSTLSAPALQSVSQIGPNEAATLPNRYQFGYSGFFERPLLYSITTPHPSGAGTATARIERGNGGRVVRLVDGNGNRREYQYGANQTLVEIKNAAGTVASRWTQKWDNAGRDTGVLDSNGVGTTLEYGDFENPWRATRVVDAMNRVWETRYDDFGNITSVNAPGQLATGYLHDYDAFALGRLREIRQFYNGDGDHPIRVPASFSYFEPSGLVQSVTTPHPNGDGQVTTSFSYNALGDVTSIVAPGHPGAPTMTTTLNYNVDGDYAQPERRGQPLLIVDNAGHTTHLRYDERGNVTTSYDAQGQRGDANYNLADQVVETLSPASGQTGTGRTRSVATYAFVGGPSIAAQSFDESGAPVMQQNWTLGSEGEVLGVGGWGETSSYTYTAEYQVATLADGRGRKTFYSYNLDGNLIRTRLPEANGESGAGIQRSTHFWPDHQPRRAIDGRGQIATYEYNDARGLPTAVRFANRAPDDVTRTYDIWGRLKTGANGTAQLAFRYASTSSDALQSTLTTYRRQDGTALPSLWVSATYNANGSRAGLTSPGGNFAYTYDAAGRLSQLRNPQNPQNQSTRWTYTPNHWLQSQTLSNGAQSTFTRNAVGQTVGLTHRKRAGALLSRFGDETDLARQLRYNGVGQMTERPAAFALQAGQPSLSHRQRFSYDTDSPASPSAGSLRRELHNFVGGPRELDMTHHFDAAGNPTFQTATSATPGNPPVTSTSTRTFNAANQETTLDANSAIQFAYDGNGNPTLYRGREATYDAHNRLSSWNGSSAGYRPDGLRAWRQSTLEGLRALSISQVRRWGVPKKYVLRFETW